MGSVVEIKKRSGPDVREIGALVVGLAARIGVGQEGNRIGITPVANKIDREQPGFRAAIDIFGSTGSQLAEIGGGASEGLGRHVVTAHGQRIAIAGGQHEIAAYVDVVAEAVGQQLLQFADRHSGVGHLDLDVGGPGVLGL